MYEFLDALPRWQHTLLGTLIGCCIGLWLCKLGDAILDKIRKKAKQKEDYSRLMYGGKGMSCCFLSSHAPRQSLLYKGLPGVYTAQIKNQEDMNLHLRRIADCTFLFDGRFVIRGYGEGEVELDLVPTDASKITPVKNNIRFIHIEGHVSGSCSICDVSEQGNRKVNFHSAVLSYIKPSDSIGIIMNDYQKPVGITIDYGGDNIFYKIKNSTGSIKGEILGNAAFV